MSDVCHHGCSIHVKQCLECKESKPLEEFQGLKKPNYKKGPFKSTGPTSYHRKICNTCRNIQKRDAGLRNRYGISLQQYNEMLLAQNGVCKICREVCPTGRHLAVDHCHTTGKVRGLLCVRCNQGLGHFIDDEQRILRMLEYVRTHRGL